MGMKNALGDREEVREILKRLGIKEGDKPDNPTQAYDVESILYGQTFFDTSLPVALRSALEYAAPDGIVASMPCIIAAKAIADKSHAFWQDWYTVQTEEDIGIDKKGSFYTRGKPVLVVVHGGGILAPDRIQKAYDENLLNNSARYREEEFDALLEGRLANGISFPLYRLEEIQSGKSGLPHQFGVVMPYKTAQYTKSGYHQKKAFLENPLVIARAAGSLDQLEAFYEKAKALDGGLGNYHPFKGRDASMPQGRVLIAYPDFSGLIGYNNLDSNGRFVGVAAGALSKEK